MPRRTAIPRASSRCRVSRSSASSSEGPCPRSVPAAMARTSWVDVVAVRAENLVRGSGQQGCSSGRPAVMITDHVPAVRVPPDYAGRRGVAAVTA
jgi:hypothetical protein